LPQGCPANVVTFNTLIDVYGKSGQWEQALGVLEQMKREVSRAFT
jgi:pentatricopeptide repeat domain-containing protein 1